ncbi:MAG: ATP synthase F1 subunit delta [Acidimicrobiia bacterium]|nr:ATP synthase F1 subunit delta [Acidimicrobiia bacterium]
MSDRTAAAGARVEAYATALLEVARAEGTLGEVEDELFRFARAVEGNDALRLALTDQALPVERRIAVVEELLEAKALRTTVALASLLVGAGRAGDMSAIIERFVEKAAAERAHEVAEVRSAIPLDEGQRRRLAEALSAATGKQVEVVLVVDPKVMGGLVARIGDTVIDGTVSHRLEQLKERT